MSTEDQSKLNHLKDSLYSRTGFIPDNPIKPLDKIEHSAPKSWQTIPDLPVRQGVPLIKIIIWASVAFFSMAVIIAGFLFYTGYNTISTSNVMVNISGPTTIAGGEDASIGITVENRNKVTINDVYLVIEYPEGARKNIDSFEPLERERISLGSIESGAFSNKVIQAVFFGEERSFKEISAKVQYTVAESSGLFEQKKDYKFVLGPSPIQVTMKTQETLSSGQEIVVDVEIISNSTRSLSNVALLMSYPVGFSFVKAVTAPNVGSDTWIFNTINPGEKHNIKITGKLEGLENEQRAFRYTLGARNPNGSQGIETPYITDTKTVTMQRPFIGFDFKINGEEQSTYYIDSGSLVSVNLGVINHVSEKLQNVVIETKIHGAYLDSSSIRPGQGFFQTATNIISWDSRQVPTLRSLDPNGRSNVQFTFGTIPFSQSNQAQTNQPITITVTARGTRTSDLNNQQIVSSSITRVVKFLSEASLSGETLYNEGPFANRGPLPPKAEEETTYTIVWNVKNTYNQLSDARVVAVLPSYVKYLDNKSPASEQVVYNPATGELSWNIGNVVANTGYGSLPRQVAFQVSIIPSRTQIGTSPILVESAELIARDALTGSDVRSRFGAVGIQMPTDSGYKPKQGVVVQ